VPLNVTSDVRNGERRYSVTVLIYSIYLTQLLTASLNVQRNYSTELHTLIRNHVKVFQSHYRPEVPRVFQDVKVPRFRDNGTGWW